VDHSPSALELADMTRIHEQSFDEAWKVSILQELLNMDGVLVVFASTDSADDGCIGFLIARLVLDEAEILTIVSAPEFRRLGIARDLLEHLIAELRCRDCKNLFLEVASANVAARQLYEAHDFQVVGKRLGYYPRAVGSSDDALIMRRELF
jgi:ribosomal-protein-alanine N-acetyltransferase